LVLELSTRNTGVTDRPNVLWYVTDQQRFDTIAALGNAFVRTPTIDALVAGGTAFTHAYCQSPICTPSRASFMTGMYPSRVHNCRNGNEDWPNHPPLISKLIADVGYDCGMVGKFHLQSSGHRTEPRLDDGYRFWKFSHAPRDDWETGHHYAEWVRAQGGDLNALRESPERVPAELHQTTWATDESIAFVDESREGPWFLTVNVYDPHPPFIPPKSYADRYDPAAMPGPHFEDRDLATQAALAAVDFQTASRRPDEFDGRRVQALYYAMIEQVDDQLARLLQHLDATGQRENTIVVFTSDHGETLGDHGLLYKGCRFYEGLVRVPLILQGPGIVAGQRCDDLVELIDISATLLDLCGARRPEAMQGRSLLPVLCGETGGYEPREFVRCEYFDALDPHFCIGDGDHTFATMYRDHRWKLVVYHGHGVGELYDLATDPWEHDNLWGSASHQSKQHELLHRSFDAAMLTGVDVGARRIAPM
jgi:arylsulfatase